jgi:hypothetical protein
MSETRFATQLLGQILLFLLYQLDQFNGEGSSDINTIIPRPWRIMTLIWRSPKYFFERTDTLAEACLKIPVSWVINAFE